MPVKYTGETRVLLMHKGNVWDVKPNDVIEELNEVPNLPNFEAVKKKGVTPDGSKAN